MTTTTSETAAQRDIAAALTLGLSMARMQGVAASCPFDDELLAQAWYAGFDEYFYNQGFQAGNLGTGVDCPYTDYEVENTWWNGYYQGHETRRRREMGLRPERKAKHATKYAKWSRDGF